MVLELYHDSDLYLNIPSGSIGRMIDAEAIKEFKQICADKYGRRFCDKHAQDAALRVIQFLINRPRLGGNLDEDEEKIMDLIRAGETGHAPSIREITQALHLSSSRSGYQMVQKLIKKRFITRDDKGRLIVLP